MRRLILGTLAYAAATFVLGFVWHLVLFASYYDSLGAYRDDIIIPFGLASMLVQGALYAWVFDRAFANARDAFWSRTMKFALFGAFLSWTYSTLAVSAKHVMSSVGDYLLIETAFTAAQWLLAAPAMALVLRNGRRNG